jgi:hypothetical protein
MGSAIVRILSIVTTAIAALGATTLPAAAADQRCAAANASYELQMGPGGDFAGATVVRVERTAPISTGILQMGPGGDFAGATVIEPERATSGSIDHVVMGPGGDFSGATVIQGAPATSERLATDGVSTACG